MHLLIVTLVDFQYYCMDLQSRDLVSFLIRYFTNSPIFYSFGCSTKLQLQQLVYGKKT